MSQTDHLGTTATTTHTDGGYTVITYHTTPVVKFNEKIIVLNTGGWYTATTKLRMNQASNQFNLGYTVQQKKGSWFVTYKGKVFLFNQHRITLER